MSEKRSPLSSTKLDQARFHRILKGKIKKNFRDFISNHQLIGKKGSDIVSIPIPRIDIPKFIFGENKSGVGQGPGKEGDPVGPGKQQPGQGQQAGNAEGQHIMEVEVSYDELAAFLEDELRLPNLEPKQNQKFEDESKRYSSIIQSGPDSLRHFKRTYKESLKRQISVGSYDPDNPLVLPIKQDFRYRHRKKITQPQYNAVVIYMMDISGSMGNEQKEIVRTEAFWIDLWVNRHYKNVEKRFIVHDSTAKEATRDEFFHLKESGGTLISSALNLCQDVIERDYPVSDWNIYCFYFSDGDNWSQEDTQLCVQMLTDKVLTKVNLFGYGQVESRYGSGQFYRDLQKCNEKLPGLVISKIDNKDAIPRSIKDFFKAS
jgi:uncharacterized protein